MIKRITFLLLIVCLCLNFSYGALDDYKKELQLRNQEFLESIQNLDHKEKKDAILRQKFQYTKEIRDKEEELFFIDRQRRSMDYEERKQKVKELKGEILELQRTISSLR